MILFPRKTSSVEPPIRTNYSNIFHLSPEKVTSIIQSWNVRFDGTSQGLRCDEFIYRIRSLTQENFNGDFEVVYKNLPILLTNKATLRYQYKDYTSNFDIQEELRNRKQKPSESFETFYDSVSEIIDRLPTQIDESELVE